MTVERCACPGCTDPPLFGRAFCLKCGSVNSANECGHGEPSPERCSCGEALALRADLLLIAQATGIVFAADGRGDEPGPIDRIVTEIRSVSTERDTLREQLKEARALLEDAVDSIRGIFGGPRSRLQEDVIARYDARVYR